MVVLVVERTWARGWLVAQVALIWLLVPRLGLLQGLLEEQEQLGLRLILVALVWLQGQSLVEEPV